MGQVVHVNGDYTIKARVNASTLGRESRITLDTGSVNGQIKVIGNLVVDGTTVTVNQANLDIQDNIIVLNKGETGNIFSPGGGVTEGVAGIEIDRGPTLDRAAFYYDEFDDAWVIAQRPSTIAEIDVDAGSYNFSVSKLRLSTILTNSNDNLILINSGTGVVNVGNRNPTADPLLRNYEDLVLDEDDVPNRKFVLDAIQGQPARQIISDADGLTPSRVIISDADSGDLDKNGNVVTETEIAVFVDNQQMATFFNDRIRLRALLIDDTAISTIGTFIGNNIVLNTASAKLETNYALQLNYVGTALPGAVSNNLILQARVPEAGNTGFFFVHNNDNDELISKRKALIFSILF